METADIAEHSGSHHHPPATNQTADPVTAMMARAATEEYGFLRTFLPRSHPLDAPELSTLLSGAAIAFASLLVDNITYYSRAI